MKRAPLVRKWSAVGIILLFVGIACAPAIAEQNTEKQSVSRGTWLYVGGSGPGNYSRIQDAIDNASDGDTVFVFSGIYYERIVIRKAISFLGESRNTTIIDAVTQDQGYLISLASGNIRISGFTLRFNGDYGPPSFIIVNLIPYDACNIVISDNILQTNMSNGIYLVYGHNCRIINNIITTDETGYGWGGIELLAIDNSTIANNSIMSNLIGCKLSNSRFNIISNNDFYDTVSKAISLQGYSNNNLIHANKIDNPKTLYMFLNRLTGIYSSHNNHNIITGNSITHCMFGIYLEESQDTTISQNTFLKNLVHARFHNTGFFSTTWDRNYWGRPQTLPKPIFGIKDMHHFFPGFVEFDWHPAREPYYIGGI